MIELRFHPDESQLLQTIDGIPDTAYIAHGALSLLQDGPRRTYTVTQYSFYYPENPGYNCWTRDSSCGYHEHDVEFVSIYERDGSPTLVYFSAHARGQGCWRELSKCRTNRLGHLIVYVAKNSHACYPEPGIYTRVFGFANDICSDKGKWVKPKLVPSITHSFANGIYLSKEVRPAPSSTSITPWQRFMIPFYEDQRRASL